MSNDQLEYFNLDEFISEHFKVKKMLLIIVGLWPYQSRLRRMLVMSVYNIDMFLVLISEILEIFTMDDKSVSSYTKSFMYILPTICIIDIYNALNFKMKETKSLWRMSMDCWNILESKDEVNIAHAYSLKSKFYTLIFLAFVSILFVAFFGYTITLLYLDYDMTEAIFMPLYVPFDMNKYFKETLILFVATSLMFVFTTASTYSISMYAVQHICTFLEIAGHVIMTAFENKNERNINEKLIRGIKIHRMALRYLDYMNRCWEYTCLFQSGLTVLIITIDFVHIFHLQEISKETFLNTCIEITYIFTTMVYIFITFYVGQKVRNGSTKLYTTICSLPWYDLPIKTQKLFLLLILKSRKECYISIGKSYEMSYELYALIVRTAMTYAMMIHSLQ